MGEKFVCPICGNKDPRKIGYRNGHPYCRVCLSFSGTKVIASDPIRKISPVTITYPLTQDQINLSVKILENYLNGIDTLVYAVCGAGKTELVFQTIQAVISRGGKVAFCVPRRDVVIELYERLKRAFLANNVIAVYGGHNEVLDGDLICLTSHQLYRYPNYFDLVIMDEIDAFPFQNNEVLNAFFEKSIKGHYVMMSATPNEETLHYFEGKDKAVLTLFSRFHGHNLAEPVIKVRYGLLKKIELMSWMKRFHQKGKPVFVFTPTIDVCESIYSFLRIYFRGGMCVHSKKDDRNKIIEDFKNHKYWYLVTTAVLERGVTVSDLQVIVYESDHRIYDEYALNQISGRAGRKLDHPDGDVIFICEKVTKDMTNCINEIKRVNANLQSLL